MSGCRKGEYEMTTANNIKGQNINNDLITALYCRLSVEDIKDDKNNKRRNIDESNSISNQKQILSDYAKKHGYTNTMFFVDKAVARLIQGISQKGLISGLFANSRPMRSYFFALSPVR